jgi:excisionase family DNA binding protein
MAGTMISPNARLLGADEAAALLGVSEKRLYALSRAGIVPSVRLGRNVKWSSVALDGFIESGGRRIPTGAEMATHPA